MGEIVVTWKGTMSKPWIVVHAENGEESLRLQREAQDPAFMESVLNGEAAYTAFVPRTVDQLLQQELGAVPVSPEPVPTAPAAPVWGPPTPPVQQAAYGVPAANGGRACVHGPMTLKEGRSARGAWSAWMCSWGDADTRCQPVDAVTGKSWPKK